MKKWSPALTIVSLLLCLDIVLRMAGGPATTGVAFAQRSADRQPIDLSAVRTDNDNYLLYRMWSDGSIDVRLVNPMRTQAQDWPNSDRAGISFQEGWKKFQTGP